MVFQWADRIYLFSINLLHHSQRINKNKKINHLIHLFAFCLDKKIKFGKAMDRINILVILQTDELELSVHIGPRSRYPYTVGITRYVIYVWLNFVPNQTRGWRSHYPYCTNNKTLVYTISLNLKSNNNVD